RLVGLSVRPIGSEGVPAYALPRPKSPVTPTDCEFTTEAQRALRFTEENNQLFCTLCPLCPLCLCGESDASPRGARGQHRFRALTRLPRRAHLSARRLTMAPSVQDEISRMRAILQGLEERLHAGEVPPEGLAEFKSTVDEIRLRIWALLTAAGSQAPRDTAERF